MTEIHGGRVNLRRIVLEMLLAKNTHSHIIVRDVLYKYNYLPQQEKSFIKRLYEGTTERRIELDYVIGCYSKVAVDRMKPVIRAILRMGTYQILYMDNVPDAAACNEAVKLAQKKGFGALAGFVNGVLRSIARNKGSIVYPNLSVKYSMPEWIVDLWTSQLGGETAETVLKGLLAERPVTIRLRDIKAQIGISMEDMAGELAAALDRQGGRMEQHPCLPYAYNLYKTDDITRLPYYNEGGFVVQDAGSMLAVEAVDIKNMSFDRKRDTISVVDLCAAPGGKSMLLADIFDREGVERFHILSNDIAQQKVLLMEDNFKRCGLDKNEAAVRDASEMDERLAGTADIVIADLPCSGLGVIGRKRDIKYNMTPEAIADIIRLQEKILKAAAAYVKPGGRLLFCTCTINRDENERHVQWLREELKLTPVSLSESLPACLCSETTAEGYLQLLPGVHDTDGFFISVFTK